MKKLIGLSHGTSLALCCILFLLESPVLTYSQQERYSFSLDATDASSFGIEGNQNSILLESRALTIQRILDDNPVILAIAEQDNFQDNFQITTIEILSYPNRSEKLFSYENVNNFYVEASGGLQIYPVGTTMNSYVLARAISVVSPGTSIAFEDVSRILADSPIGEAIFDIVIPPSSKVLIDDKELGESTIAMIARLHINSVHSSTAIVISGDRIDVFDWQKLEVDSYAFPLSNLFVFNGKGTIGIAVPNHTVALNGAGRLVLETVKADTTIENNGRNDFAVFSRGSTNSLTLDGVDVLSLQRQADNDPFWTPIFTGIIVAVVAGLILGLIAYAKGKIFSKGFKVTDVQLITMDSGGRTIYNIAAKITSTHPKVVKDVGVEVDVKSKGVRADFVYISQEKERRSETVESKSSEYKADYVGWSDTPDPHRAVNGTLDEIKKGESKYVIFPHNFSFAGTSSRTHRSNYSLDLTKGQKYKVKLVIRGNDGTGTIVERKVTKTLQI